MRRLQVGLLAGLFILLTARLLFAQQSDFVALYERSAESVVYVVAYFDDTRGQSGTGFIINETGEILTNRHVIVDEKTRKIARRVLVYYKPTFISGRSQEDLTRRTDATVVQQSKKLDLAILKPEQLVKTVKALPFAPPEEIKVGLDAAAIGHPLGGSLWSLTTGRISGRLRDYNSVRGLTMLQMETSINPGNSGGPLLDLQGRVLGVNTMTVRGKDNEFAIQDINFAVEAKVTTDWLSSVKIAWKKGAVTQTAIKTEPAAAKTETAKTKAPAKPEQAAAPSISGKVYPASEMQKLMQQLDEFSGKKPSFKTKKQPQKTTNETAKEKTMEEEMKEFVDEQKKELDQP